MKVNCLYKKSQSQRLALSVWAFETIPSFNAFLHPPNVIRRELHCFGDLHSKPQWLQQEEEAVKEELKLPGEPSQSRSEETDWALLGSTWAAVCRVVCMIEYLAWKNATDTFFPPCTCGLLGEH